MRHKLMALSLMVVLAGCAGTDEVSTRLPPGFLTNAQEIIAATDWSDPEVVTLTIRDHAYSPAEITFHRDRATRLVVVNASDSDHAIESEQFFPDIAVERIFGSDQTVRAPWIKKLVVPAGQTKELWFVPARFGAYPFQCSLPGHASLGERGLIDVVR